MSTILDQIDDTLNDWHGSSDAMRWTPEREADEGPLDDSDLAQVPLFPFGDIPFDLTPAPLLKPGMLVRISRAGADDQLLRVVRQLGDNRWQMRPTSPARCLDARYHQRQRNRRKRR